MVIGAGIAGLCAAHRLARAGLRVIVLEASERVGGRMHSTLRDGVPIERGAQLLSGRYRRVMGLIGELGLDAQLRPVTPWSAVARDGVPRPLCASARFASLGSGLLSAAAWARLLAGWARTRATCWTAPDDYSRWAAFDDREAGPFAAARFGAEAASWLLEPSLESFYFHGLAGSSRALLLAHMRYLTAPSTLYTLAHGLQALPDTLAAGLDVRLGAPVTALELRPNGTIGVDGGLRLRARWVVLATTADVARKLYPAATPLVERVLAARYSATVHVGVRTAVGRAMHPQLNWYGLAIPQAERRALVGIGVEAHKGFAEPGTSFTLTAAGEAAERLLALPDAMIAETLIADAERYLPGLGAACDDVLVTRWPRAAPLSPPGRSRAIAAYRAGWTAQERVLLAGDYLGMPCIEGAAETGAWAADCIERVTRSASQIAAVAVRHADRQR